MTLQNEKALKLYEGAQTDLESALSMLSDHKKPPKWMDSIRNASCTSWDYPKLVWSQVRLQKLFLFKRLRERERERGRDRRERGWRACTCLQSRSLWEAFVMPFYNVPPMTSSRLVNKFETRPLHFTGFS